MTTHKTAWGGRLAEGLRLAVLLAATLAIYRPFVSGPFFGQFDATWYHGTLADAREQFWSGTFPVYVGQGEQSWNGFPSVQRPGTFGLALALDVATAGRLRTLTLLHLVIVASALGAAVSAYFSLRWLAPGRRWSAALAALLYVSCPALLWMPFTGDMYPTFVAAPYLPLCLLGVVRCYRKPDRWAAALQAAPLALVWMAHAPLGLWMTAVMAASALVRLALVRTTWQVVRCWLLAAGLFAVFSGWYFVSVATMGVEAVAPPNADEAGSVFSLLAPSYVRSVMTNLTAATPGVFLPVGRPPSGLTDLQPGYPLLALALAGVVSLYRSEAAHKALVLATLAVAAFVLPVPWLTERLWGLLPQPFVVSTQWPMLRLWPLLAPLACFAGMLAFSRLPRSWPAACVSLALLAGLCVWSLREAEKFRAWGEAKVVTSREKASRSLLPENAALYTYAAPPGSRLHSAQRHDFERWLDPALEQRLLRRDESPLASALDSVPLSPAGQTGDVRLGDGVTLPRPYDQPGATVLARAKVRPGVRLLLAVRYRTRRFHGHLQCLGPRAYRDCWLTPDTDGEATAYLPLWTTGPEETEVEVRVVCDGTAKPGESYAEVTSLSWGPYRPADLALGLRSLIPYRASVNAPEPCLLQTPRLYVPGYEARVNGRRTATSRTQGMATVAVPAGSSWVELRYRGTPAMRLAFWVGAVGWLGLLGAALASARRRKGDRVEANPVPASGAKMAA
jgi:hypothetical protein